MMPQLLAGIADRHVAQDSMRFFVPHVSHLEMEGMRLVNGKLPSAALGHQPLGAGNRASRVEPFRAGFGAVHDGVATIKAKWVIEPVQALAGPLIAAVRKPTIGL